jgi:hypothetical protein
VVISRNGGQIQFPIPIKISNHWCYRTGVSAEIDRIVQVESAVSISQEKVIFQVEKPSSFHQVQLSVSVEIPESRPSNIDFVSHSRRVAVMELTIAFPERGKYGGLPLAGNTRDRGHQVKIPIAIHVRISCAWEKIRERGQGRRRKRGKRTVSLPSVNVQIRRGAVFEHQIQNSIPVHIGDRECLDSASALLDGSFRAGETELGQLWVGAEASVTANQAEMHFQQLNWRNRRATAESAYGLACLAAIRKDAREAVRLLKEADLSTGEQTSAYRNRAVLDEDFDGVRLTPEFVQLAGWPPGSPSSPLDTDEFPRTHGHEVPTQLEESPVGGQGQS